MKKSQMAVVLVVFTQLLCAFPAFAGDSSTPVRNELKRNKANEAVHGALFLMENAVEGGAIVLRASGKISTKATIAIEAAAILEEIATLYQYNGELKKDVALQSQLSTINTSKLLGDGQIKSDQAAQIANAGSAGSDKK